MCSGALGQIGSTSKIAILVLTTTLGDPSAAVRAAAANKTYPRSANTIANKSEFSFH